jgi:predicted transcriptional regulator
MDAPSPQDFGEIGKLVGGYRISQAIYVVVEIGIPDLLAAGPKDCDELATESNTHAPTLYRILRFLAGAGLFKEVDSKKFELTRLGSALRTDVPGSFHPMVRFLLRVCPETSGWVAKFSEHQAD